MCQLAVLNRIKYVWKMNELIIDWFLLYSAQQSYVLLHSRSLNVIIVS